MSKTKNVVDTEVYSNTDGQSSKATPAGAVAKFATSGKKIRKTITEVECRASSLALPRCSNVTESKDLDMIAKSYGYVYVAHEQNASGILPSGDSQAQYFCQRLRTPLNKDNEVSKVIKEALFSASLSKSHRLFFTYHGPSLIICYAPCISRRLRTPLNKSNKVSNVVVDTEVYSNTGGQSNNEQNFQWTFCPADVVAKLSTQDQWPQFSTSGKDF